VAGRDHSDRLPDRATAGLRLAGAVADWLAARPDLPPAVVLALPRGGVPVAAPVAARLGAPLDLLLVRKIGVPDQPELAAAAVAEGMEGRIENAHVIALSGMRAADLDSAAAHERAEIARRRARWLPGRAPLPLTGRTAVVVDDGIATGATTRAALRAVRARGAAAVLLAVPVAPSDTLRALAEEVDGTVCLLTPEPFHAIGLHYADFHQLEDAEVTALLSAPPAG
jgi:putative phosphoribosyl transferase